MSVWSRLQSALARTVVKMAALPIVPTWAAVAFRDATLPIIIREGYKANGAVYACVSALAFSFPEPRLVVSDADGNALSTHPLQRLLRRPNPIMGAAEMAAYTVTYLAVGGNAYWHKVRNKAGQVIELWPYHAAQITPLPGGEAWVRGYEYDPNGTGQAIPVPREDILHFKWPTPDPEKPWLALPPLKPVSRETDSDNELTRYLYALLKNDAMPRTALVVPAGVTLDDAQYNRLQAQWNQRFGGANRGGTAIVEGGADIKRMGLNLQEMAFDALHGVPEARIAAAFRVPPIVAGLNIGLNRSTFANYAEARESFTEQTLVPLWTLHAGEVENSLGPEFGDGLVVEHDLSTVRALADDQNKVWGRVDGAVKGGYLTVNDGRVALGYEPAAGQDVFLRSAAVMEVAGAKAGRPATRLKAAHTVHTKAASDKRKAALALGQALQRTRKAVAGRMESAVDAYFGALAGRVVARASKAWHPRLEAKDLPKADDLLTPQDEAELRETVKRFYIEVLASSWETWNTALGVEANFELTDPAVTGILQTAGARVRDIQATTLAALRELLAYGNEQGWSIDQLVRGDDTRKGLRDLIDETYKGRARTIARTELGEAQQRAAVERYGANGVKNVLVLDNGLDDSDPVCQEIGNGGAGTVKTLAWAEANPLQHPNCVRCFAPYFE